MGRRRAFNGHRRSFEPAHFGLTAGGECVLLMRRRGASRSGAAGQPQIFQPPAGQRPDLIRSNVARMVGLRLGKMPKDNAPETLGITGREQAAEGSEEPGCVVAGSGLRLVAPG